MQNELHHASIIIDDPHLKENYGFLNYRKLLHLMDKHSFFTTIAFIPWNYNRTSKNIGSLFRERQDRFSLCVHGCDHTRGEFGRKDLNYLDQKIKLATARMIEHEKKTGIPFDRVMVFPQGIFSNEALEVLKKNDYLAAVNTEALPLNGQITSNFPFFLRYNPEDVLNCVSNPILITLHHDFFKNGYNKLTDLVDELNARFKNITWDSVGNIVRHYLSNVTTDEAYNELSDVDLTGLKYHGYKENFKILSRRYASELRDNYLCRNDFLMNCAKQVKNLISK